MIIARDKERILRKTKIICTIGPSSENEETLVKMCEAGMNVARLNLGDKVVLTGGRWGLQEITLTQSKLK